MKQHTRIEANKVGSSIDEAGGGVENCLTTVSEGRVNTKVSACGGSLRDTTE
jgi:hypothetical protein